MEPIDLKEGDRVRVDGVIYRLRGDGPVWELSSEEGEKSLEEAIIETEKIRSGFVLQQRERRIKAAGRPVNAEEAIRATEEVYRKWRKMKSRWD